MGCGCSASASQPAAANKYNVAHSRRSSSDMSVAFRLPAMIASNASARQQKRYALPSADVGFSGFSDLSGADAHGLEDSSAWLLPPELDAESDKLSIDQSTDAPSEPSDCQSGSDSEETLEVEVSQDDLVAHSDTGCRQQANGQVTASPEPKCLQPEDSLALALMTSKGVESTAGICDNECVHLPGGLLDPTEISPGVSSHPKVPAKWQELIGSGKPIPLDALPPLISPSCGSSKTGMSSGTSSLDELEATLPAIAGRSSKLPLASAAKAALKHPWRDATDRFLYGCHRVQAIEPGETYAEPLVLLQSKIRPATVYRALDAFQAQTSSRRQQKHAASKVSKSSTKLPAIEQRLIQKSSVHGYESSSHIGASYPSDDDPNMLE